METLQHANAKRLQSLKQMKEGYRQQKQLIKNALSNIDNHKNNKIVFDDYGNEKSEFNVSVPPKGKRKVALFEEDEEDEKDYNFKVPNEHKGIRGHKLMQLQSQFKNDKRFKMDSRFLEDDPDEDNHEKIEDYDDEKEKQIQILESVLGEKIKRNSAKESYASKRSTNMLRFDPSQPEHSHYEVQSKQNQNSKELKKKKSTSKSVEMTSQPEVSKETFYNVENDFKKTLYETQEFSLSKLFNGVIEEEETTEKQSKEMPISIKPTQEYDSNPFKYDSSDDEGKEESKVVSEPIIERAEKIQVKPRLWTETFFFKEDDFRLQEGFDFIKRLQLGEQEDFRTVRRNLKEIIRAKVKNNLRKNRPFKRKLGGGNKKRIKIKKALKC